METLTKRTYRIQPRLSFDALESFLLGCDADVRHLDGTSGDHRVMAGALAHRIGRPVGSVHRWRKLGIPLTTADAIAIHLDVHPVNIWPDFHQEQR